MTKIFYKLSVIAFIILIPALLHGAEVNEETFRVDLRVSSSNEYLRTELLSGLNSELRRLGDVSVVDDGAEYVIQIVASELINFQNIVTGFATSTIILSPFDNKQLIKLTKEELKPSTPLGRAVGFDFDNPELSLINDPVKYVQFITENLGRIEEHFLDIDARQNVPNICRSIISRFDVGHLENSRKIRKMLKAGLKKSLNTKR